MNNELTKRFIGTDNFDEFSRWKEYMDNHEIKHKARVRNLAGRYKCDIELIGYGKDEVEEIKEEIGYYYD